MSRCTKHTGYQGQTHQGISQGSCGKPWDSRPRANSSSRHTFFWQEPQDKEWSMHRGCVPLGRIMPHIAISSWTLWGWSQVSATIGANGVGLEWMKFVPFGRFKAVCARLRWSLDFFFFSCILRKIQEAEVEVAKIQMAEQGREDQKGEHQRDGEGYGCFGDKSR